MPETLDHLIDRIKTEGIEKAEQEGAQRLAEAEASAARIVREAEVKAAELIEQGEKEARQFEQRGQQSLAQAARDTLLTVSKAIDQLFDELARRSLKESMTTDAWRELIAGVVKRYFAQPDTQRDVMLLVSKDDAEAIGKYLMNQFGKAAENGLSVGTDDDLTGGFRVEIKDANLFHDLSEEAIAQLLCKFLRPQLAELTREALKTMSSDTRTSTA